MKYGVLLNKFNRNLGDDIQAYATARFYPSLDYMIDREDIHHFQSENNEPVAVIMGAWYMWEKWHWPPSRCIVPLMISMHYADHELAKQPGSPLKYEAFEGLGGEYLKSYAPIGCRDYFTRDQLKKLGIDSYFSGCITLTLPQMPVVKPEKEYICIVDVDQRVKNRLSELLGDSGYELKFITHNGERDITRTWEQRKEIVEELLTTYRNAKCVITKRLHCALPCLAQGTPVALIKQMTDDIRFSPYYDYLYYINTDDFLAGNYDYDFTNPKPNKTDYIPTRDALIRSCEDFIARVSTEERSTAELDRFTPTDEEVYRWRYDLMDQTLSMWLEKTRLDYKERRTLQGQFNKMEQRVDTLKEKNAQLVDRKNRLVEKNKRLSQKNKELSEENNRLPKENKQLAEDNKKLIEENKRLTERNLWLARNLGVVGRLKRVVARVIK